MVHLCMPTCESRHPEFREVGVTSFGAGVPGSDEPPDMDVKEMNLDPLEGQQVLLTTGPSF